VFRDYRVKAKPWCIAWKGVDGKLHKEKTDAPTKELAKKLLSKRLVEVIEAKVAGVTIDQKPITFTEFMKEYLKHVEARKTPGSQDRDKGVVDRLKKRFGGKRLKEFTTGMIQRYADDRMHETHHNKRPYKPATINRELICLSAIFREAVKRQYVSINPVRGVKLLPMDNKIVRYLSDDEEMALLGACNVGLRPIVICALHTGMRKGEILKLTWDDVDLDQRLIRVQHTKSRRTRYIPINTVLYGELKALPTYKGVPFVFVNPDTEDQWCDEKIAWKYAIRKSKVKNFRFHDLRHTFASRLVQAGVQLKAVQELLGHASIEMTMRYAHLSPDDLRRAVEVLVKKAPETASESEPNPKDKQEGSR
jgi:integrase